MSNLDLYLSAAVSVISAVAMTTQAWLLYRASRYQNHTELMKIRMDEKRSVEPSQSRETAPEQERPTGDPNANNQVQRI
ncbi:hypothetical protein [Glycomyces dulcitolivorans]|uniref:hypothetical protein n=1 Tax=Glycomyces dulcitolivorans TaxID=2200759 RepID=UPI0013003A00|nr:hypothetical protein [Glycomyces dulcitolivorans]